MLKRVFHFLGQDIWRIRLKDAPRRKSFFIQPLRILILALRGFDEDKCTLRASALTFYSLLSIVPIVAMAFGIAKGFGFEKRIQQLLLERFSGQEDVLKEIIGFAQNLLDNTRGGLIAGIGVVLLFWAVIKILSNIEKSFNAIWGIQKPRTLGRKFADYLSFALLAPVLLILSTSLTVFVNEQVTLITERIKMLNVMAPLILAAMKILPYIVIWILFTFIFYFMPNTKVRFPSSLVAGILAGTLFQIIQWGYVTFQVGVAKYNSIYGSFAALPLFLIWLQISWLIVLLGAEISFAHQNVATYEFEPQCHEVSHSFKTLLALAIVHRLVKNFCQGVKPWDAEQLSHELDMPIRLVHEMLEQLAAADVLTEIKEEQQKNTYYQPARDVQDLTVQFVIGALETQGRTSIPLPETEELTRLQHCLSSFDTLMQNSQDNHALKDI